MNDDYGEPYDGDEVQGEGFEESLGGDQPSRRWHARLPNPDELWSDLDDKQAENLARAMFEHGMRLREQMLNGWAGAPLMNIDQARLFDNEITRIAVRYGVQPDSTDEEFRNQVQAYASFPSEYLARFEAWAAKKSHARQQETLAREYRKRAARVKPGSLEMMMLRDEFRRKGLDI